MNKLIISLIVVINAVACLAAETNTTQIAVKRKFVNRSGMVIKPGSMQGKIVFVDAQTAIDHAVFAEVAANWKKMIRLNISVVKGKSVTPKTASTAVTEVNANLVLFIVDDPEVETSILYAPETKWCILNVRPIFADKPESKIAKVRAMQETTRAFSLLCGAMNSTYPNSLMSAVTAPQQLDLNEEPWMVPIDVMERFPAWCTAHGIKPYRSASYRKACMEGWAPSPTNDAQRAIWNQVHQIPSNPLPLVKPTK